MTISIGDPAPDIELPATGDQTFSPAGFKQQFLVLYFYPKDSTPGCTTEGKDFSAAYEEFKAAGAEILGVSREGIRSHENFKAKQSFPFELLSDKDEELCKAMDVIKEKSMYGKTYMGIERSTFLFDQDGKLAREWRKVKVKGHVAEVLDAVQALAQA